MQKKKLFILLIFHKLRRQQFLDETNDFNLVSG